MLCAKIPGDLHTCYIVSKSCSITVPVVCWVLKNPDDLRTCYIVSKTCSLTVPVVCWVFQLRTRSLQGSRPTLVRWQLRTIRQAPLLGNHSSSSRRSSIPATHSLHKVGSVALCCVAIWDRLLWPCVVWTFGTDFFGLVLCGHLGQTSLALCCVDIWDRLL